MLNAIKGLKGISKEELLKKAEKMAKAKIEEILRDPQGTLNGMSKSKAISLALKGIKKSILVALGVSNPILVLIIGSVIDKLAEKVLDEAIKALSKSNGN